jgi:VWFA-related protein
MSRATLLRFFRTCCLLAFLSSLAGSLYGQSAGTASSQPSPTGGSGASTPSVVSDVDEVPIDFVVRNKKKPVLDLKPEDVIVTDDGTTVKLSVLRLVTGHSAPNHLISLVFDPLDPSGATNARDVARKILKVFPAQGFSFAVFNIDTRLHLQQEFTTDRQELQKAFVAATSDETTRRSDSSAAAEKRLISVVQSGADQGQLPSSTGDREIQQATLASLSESQRIIQDQHIQPSPAGLLALIRSQAKIPGRKLLIYFTLGLAATPDAREMVRSIAAAANRAEVSIYVINQTAVDSKLMEGLMETAAVGQVAATNHSSPMFPAAGESQTPLPFGPGLATSLSNTLTRMEGEGLAGNGDPLGGLAANTGGAYIFSEDNLKKPFKQAIADLTTYYEASYVPSGLVYDGKFHAISVKTVQRGPKVQARAGYFAIPRSTGVRPFEVPLMKVLSEPQLPTDVAFHAGVLNLGNLTTGNESTLVVEVPVSSLETRKDVNANLITWHVSIVSVVKDKAGAIMEHFSEDISGHGALDIKETSGAIMQRHFALPPGSYMLETAVADRFVGKVGGERTHFEIPEPAPGPFLSDVVLVRRIDSSSEEVDPFEPLRYQHGKVVPNLSEQMTPGTKEMSFFFLVHSDSSMPDPALLEMQILRNGELLTQVPLQLPKNLPEAFPYVASLKAASLPAGNYDVRVSLSKGNRTMERENRFSIAGAELANAALGKGEALKPDGEATAMADAIQGEGDIPATKRPELLITSLPATSFARPTNDELDGIIAGARKQALNYSAKLPNFLCVEVTDRSVDSSGTGRWRRKDSFGELLRYVDSHETRTTLEVNGHPSSEKRADMHGPTSLGEFGHLLSLVFQPSSQAEFHWKETDALAGGTVQVFEYRVDRKHDSMELDDSGGKVYAGFHGLAYIDGSTHGVRRITMEPDDLPTNFSIHAASISVDYDYVTVGTHDYLMPVRGTIRLKRGKRESDLNQIVFQDYRRYASQSRIIVKP